VSVQRWPVQWTGKRAVIQLPSDVDTSNAGKVREQLMTLVEDDGAVVVVADMTRTTFCDSAGITALATAHKKVSAMGADLKVIAAAPQVLRILELTGLDGVLNVYPTVDAALAG
jgi:anti-sigma B factor antagonist